jgi:hypothetical protein
VSFIGGFGELPSNLLTMVGDLDVSEYRGGHITGRQVLIGIQTQAGYYYVLN